MVSLDRLLRPAPIVLIVPPFHWTARPSLGVHLLQAVGRRTGLEVQVVYANLLLAARFGRRTYDTLSAVPDATFLGERLFARAAYGLPPLGRDRGAGIAVRLEATRRVHEAAGRELDVTVESFERIEQAIPPWVDALALALAGGPRVIGCTSSFEQTAASLAILGAVKRHAPDTITILGGANCEGEMAHGMLALGDAVDHVFSGESEDTFRRFVAAIRDGARPAERIFDGRPCEALDELPELDYADYYEQLTAWLPDQLDEARLPFETSRGCWWGEKKHCTFCGLNGQGMASREKSPDRAIAELGALLDAHPNRKVTFVDNIMPHAYWKTFVPRLPDELPGLDAAYEQKANLTLDQVRALARAGIRWIQPGIEALSTGLLKLMAKGTTCAQNVALLRYAAAVDMTVYWNLLCGFPGDDRAFYDETLELVPLLHHLPPPRLATPIVIDRFSPYFTFPERHGVRDLRPLAGYREILPAHVDPRQVAYHWEASFASASLEDPSLIRRLECEVLAWRDAYHGARPRLTVEGELDGELWLIDTRGLPGTEPRRPLTRGEAITALVAQRTHAASRSAVAWAAEARVVVIRDGRYVPLATARPALMAEAARRAGGEQLRVVS